MKELEDIVKGFNKNISIYEEKIYSKFGLKNGDSILIEYFTDIEREIYKDNLIIDDTKGVLEYIYSIPGNILNVVENKKIEFEDYINKTIIKNKSLNITSSQGLFKSKK